jgi:zinc D-Ala-D-Ala carboxypeptidase
MNLTANFTLDEFTQSSKANEFGIDNTPGIDEIRNLQKIADLMQQVRDVCGGNPVKISSGFRCGDLNRVIGGSATSAHRYGLAADFTIPRFGSPRAICEELIAAGLVWDQLILEHPTTEQPDGKWVHLGLPILGKPRRQVLTAIKRPKAIHYAAGLVMP